MGLERNGQVLIKPFCPPYYPTMKDAVLAFLESKFAPGKGSFWDGGAIAASGWMHDLSRHAFPSTRLLRYRRP